MFLTAILVGVGMLLTTGLSVWGILIVVLVDVAGLWLALIYFLALRHYLPHILMQDADMLMINHFIIPLCASLLVGRLVTMFVASYYAKPPEIPKTPRR